MYVLKTWMSASRNMLFVWLMCCAIFVAAVDSNRMNHTSFWVIADVPYSRHESVVVSRQVKILESNVDFLVHLGDIKSEHTPCGQLALDEADSILRGSPVPVFIIVGDNEYNDCYNIAPSRALELWRNSFSRYDLKYWKHEIEVEQMATRPETFSFVYKLTLFIGLNLVAGDVRDLDEWNTRLDEQVKWVKGLMMKNKSSIHSVVLFGHADPVQHHSRFFKPLSVFLQKDFPERIPVLYLCGDAHKWGYDPGYLKVDNSLRVRLSGGIREPIVKITVDPIQYGFKATNAFLVERFL
jgi:Calcineurin-like phosphoesterase